MERAGELYFSLEFSGKNISELGSGKKRESLFYLTEEAIKELYSRGEKLGVEILPPLSLNEINSRTGEKRAKGLYFPDLTNSCFTDLGRGIFAGGQSLSFRPPWHFLSSKPPTFPKR